MKEESYTVGEITKLKELSVTTLHHYDKIGLLKPDSRSSAKYRLYSHTNLKRLDRILFYRELGFSLREITSLLLDTTNTVSMLRRQLLSLDESRYNLSGKIDKIMNAIAITEGSCQYELWSCDRHCDMCLFADKDIPKGELVYSRVTPRLIFDIDQEQYNTLTLKQVTGKYLLKNSHWDELEEIYHIDCDALPFIRRNAKPNLVQDPSRNDIYLIAAQVIKSESEITR
jgi:DNA-binding transcriptional MerR regulator